MDLLRVPTRKAVLAFGLDKWAVIDPFESKHNQVARWREERYTHAAKFRSGSDVVYGLSRGLDHDGIGKGQRILSGAACAASHAQLKGKTALLIIEVPDQSGSVAAVAVVGLENGLVVLDKLLTPEEVTDARQNFAHKVKGEFEVHGSSTATQVHYPLELDGLVPKSGNASAIEPLRATRGFIILGSVFGVAALGVAGYMGFSAWQAQSKHAAAQRALMQNRPDVQYRASVQRLLDGPVVPLAGALAAVRERFEDFPLVQAGWELQRIVCTPAGACEVRFKRLGGSGATIEDFRAAAAPEWQGITAINLDELVFSTPLQLPSAKLQRATWPTAAAFRDQNFSQWQLMSPTGWRADLGPASIQAVPGHLTPTEIAPLGQLPEAVYAMPLTVSSQPWWFVDGSVQSPMNAQFLGEHTVLTGEIELLHASNSITFSAKGMSYVQR